MRQQNAPISLSDLMKLLDRQYPERSVRRWLSEMVEASLVDAAFAPLLPFVIAKMLKRLFQGLLR